MNREMEYREREINLLHLLCYMLEKYKSLVVVLVIGVVLSLAVGIIKKPEPVVQEEMENIDTSIDEYEPTEEMKQSMEIAYQFRQVFEQQKEYNDNSIIMQLDSNKVYEGRVTYYLSTIGDEGELSASYVAIIENEDFLEEIAKVAGTESSYIREVISASYARSSFNQETDVAAGVITYSVTHYDYDVCREILDSWMEQVEKYHQQYSNKYGDYEFRKVADVLTEKINNGFVDKQNGHVTKLNNFNNTMVSHESKFTGKDLTYYQKHYLKEQIDVDDNVIEKPKKESNLIGYLVIGATFSILFWGIFWVVRYLLNDKIQTKEEVERRYDIPVLGYISNQNKKKKLYSNWKKYTYDSDEYLMYTLKSICENGIVVCGFKKDEFCEDNIVCYADYLWKNSEAMKKAKEMGNVVIGINLYKSTYGEIEREIEMCMLQKINIIGAIVSE